MTNPFSSTKIKLI